MLGLLNISKTYSPLSMILKFTKPYKEIDLDKTFLLIKIKVRLKKYMRKEAKNTHNFCFLLKKEGLFFLYFRIFGDSCSFVEDRIFS